MKLPSSAPSPCRARAPVIPRSRPCGATLRVSSYPLALLRFPSTTAPNTLGGGLPVPPVPAAQDPQAWEPSEGRPHPSPPSPVSRAEARQAGMRLRRGAGRGAPSGHRASPSRHRGSAELGCSSDIRFGLARSATTSEAPALPVYTAAAPETSELQRLQPIPAQPQPAAARRLHNS